MNYIWPLLYLNMEILEFKTISSQKGPEILKIKGSKFLSYAIPAKSRETVQLLLNKFRKKYYDSTHVCFACRLIENDQEYFRYNDDGEGWTISNIENGENGEIIFCNDELFTVRLGETIQSVTNFHTTKILET